MNENQNWLDKMGISSPELEQLIRTSLSAGALGAKLSGGGGGGNMICLIDEARETQIYQALLEAGAAQITATTLK